MVAMILFAILGAVVSFAAMFVVLSLRQAALLILVIVAPIAFALNLLPNTKSIFDKWFKMFKGLLLLYPIIGVVVGGSMLAVSILGTTHTFMGELSALIVSFLPFVAIPTLLKGAISAIDKATGVGIGSKISGYGDKYRAQANKRAGAGFQRSQMGQNIAAMKRVHQSKLTTKANKNAAKAAKGGFRGALARGFVPRGKATISDLQGHGRAEQNKQNKEALEEADAWVQENGRDIKGLSNEQIMNVAESGELNGQTLSSAQYAAFVKDRSGALDKTQRTKVLEAAANRLKDDDNTDNSLSRAAIADGIKDAGGSWAGGGAMANFKQGKWEAGTANKSIESAKTSLENSAADITAEKMSDLKGLYGSEDQAKEKINNAFMSPTLTHDAASSLAEASGLDNDTREAARAAFKARDGSDVPWSSSNQGSNAPVVPTPLPTGGQGSQPGGGFATDLNGSQSEFDEWRRSQDRSQSSRK